MQRTLIHADDLLLDSFRLAIEVYRSGFKPDFLVGLWRGGSAVGIAVQEGLEYLGVDTDHIAIRTSYAGRDSYSRMIGVDGKIRVHGLQYLLEHLESDSRLLIVDDVYSTGSSVAAVIAALAKKLRRNRPEDIRTAAVWYRPTERTLSAPDFFIRETSDWLVLPYELTGLSVEEICHEKPGLKAIMEDLGEFFPAAARDAR